MKKNSIMTIGSVTRDIFISDIEMLLQKQPDVISFPEGIKQNVGTISCKIGGGAANAAFSFSRLGFSTGCFFKAGSDDAAQQIASALSTAGVTLCNPVYGADMLTGTSFILTAPSGNHTVLAFRGANATLLKSELPLDSLSRYESVYISSLSETSAQILPFLCEQAKSSGLLVAHNPGASQLKNQTQTILESAQWIDLLIMNAQEATLLFSTLTGKSACDEQHGLLKNLLKKFMAIDGEPLSLKQFFAEIHALGPKVVVVTNGAEGVYASDGQSFFFQKSIPVSVASTVGAGDAFGSCFVASIMQGKSIEEALRRGVINSASVIQHLGAQEGLLLAPALEKQQAVLKGDHSVIEGNL